MIEISSFFDGHKAFFFVQAVVIARLLVSDIDDHGKARRDDEEHERGTWSQQK